MAEKLSAPEVAYLKQVKGQLRGADERLAHAAKLEAQAQQLRLEAAALAGAHESYVEYLGVCYRLGPNDTVDEDGLIRRGGAVARNGPVALGEVEG